MKKNLKLLINKEEGEVTLSFNLDDFNEDYEVFLEDKVNGSWMNLNVIADYYYVPNELGEKHDRFVIHLKKKTNDIATSVKNFENKNSQGIKISGFAEYVQIGISHSLYQSVDNATIEVLDINGRLIQRHVTTNTDCRISLPEQNGVYIVRVNIGGVVETEKVVR
ncbi:MAG: T9SS type A sorting domain-containing protein [Desulfosudaceae bacterium]